jgi:hypothetical protein
MRTHAAMLARAGRMIAVLERRGIGVGRVGTWFDII